MPRAGQEIGPLEQQVMLAIMRLRSEAYGVSIHDFLESKTHRQYSVGAIYAALERLEEKGFVVSKVGEATPQRGGRKKLYFNLTAPGVATLDRSLHAIDTLRRGLRVKEALA